MNCHRNPRCRRRDRPAFTLMEIMVVIGIILLLMGIGVVGYRSLDRSVAEKQTKTTLANAQAMMANYEAVNGLGEFAAKFDSGGTMNSTDAMAILLKMQKNKEAFAGLPSKMVKGKSLIDGWGTDIQLIGPKGMTIQPAGTPTPPTAQLRAPSNRPFWVSAGPDGDMAKSEDNLYSFDK